MSLRFAALPPADTSRHFETSIVVASVENAVFLPSITIKTDSLGRAAARVGFGTISGRTGVRVIVPSLGLEDTVLYTVSPGNPTRMKLLDKDTLVATGSTYGIRVAVVDRVGNSTSEPIIYSAGPGVVASPSGSVTVGGSVARSYVALTSRFGVDTSRVSVVPKWDMVADRYNGRDFSVYTLKADGSEVTEIATSGSLYISPERSAAASSVAYYQGDPASNASIVVVDPKKVGRIIVGPNAFASGYWPRWSNDGLWIYFVGQRRSADVRSIWRVRADGSGLDSLTHVAATGFLVPPAPSPDGRSIAISDTSGLRIFDIAARTSRVLRPGCSMPRYSAEGNGLACIANSAAVVMNADGSNRRVLPGFGCVSSPDTCIDEIYGVDWSPDGRWLVMALGSATQILVNVDDGSRVPLVTLRFYRLAFAR
jgi:hypothetical protein